MTTTTTTDPLIDWRNRAKEYHHHARLALVAAGTRLSALRPTLLSDDPLLTAATLAVHAAERAYVDAGAQVDRLRELDGDWIAAMSAAVVPGPAQARLRERADDIRAEASTAVRIAHRSMLAARYALDSMPRDTTTEGTE